MWNCPVCLEIPKNEIFQCSIGHSLCASCKLYIDGCPLCRAPINTIRNFLAEELLDKYLFECPWKNQGCLELVTRQELPTHEEMCKDGLLFSCSKTTYFAKCKFSCKIPRNNDNSSKVTELLDHMKNQHGCPVRKHCSDDTLVQTSLNTRKLKKIAQTHPIGTLSHVFLQFENCGKASEVIPRSEAIMVVNKVHRINQTELVISWTFVMLTCSDDVSNFLVNVFYTNKCNTTSKSLTKPIRVSEFRQYLKMAEKSNETNFCKQSVVVGNCEDIQTNKAGVFTLSYNVQTINAKTK